MAELLLGVYLPGVCWWLSYDYAGSVFRSSGKVRYELAWFNGRVVLVRHRSWAWDELFQFHVESSAEDSTNSLIEGSPGWLPDSHL